MHLSWPLNTRSFYAMYLLGTALRIYDKALRPFKHHGPGNFNADRLDARHPSVMKVSAPRVAESCKI